MSTLNLATQIPSQINTLEKLHAWSGLALGYMYPTLKAIEGVGYEERVAQANVFYIAADNKYRLISRVSLQVSPDFLSGGSKMWNYMMEVGNTAIPTTFVAN